MADVRFIKACGNSRRRDSRSRTLMKHAQGTYVSGLPAKSVRLGVQPGRSTESLAGAPTVDYSHARAIAPNVYNTQRPASRPLPVDDQAQGGASSSIRKTGGSALGATNVV